MLANPRACFACKSHSKARGGDVENNEDDDDVDKNNAIFDLERLKEFGDRFTSLSTEAFCLIVETTFDMSNDLR